MKNGYKKISHCLVILITVASSSAHGFSEVMFMPDKAPKAMLLQTTAPPLVPDIDSQPSLNNTQSRVLLPPYVQIIQIPKTKPGTTLPSIPEGGDPDTGANKQANAKPAAVNPALSPISIQCKASDNLAYSRLPRETYRAANANLHKGTGHLRLSRFPLRNIQLPIFPRTALELINQLMSDPVPAQFLQAVLPGVIPSAPLEHPHLEFLLEIYDDAIQYFHTEFGYFPPLAAAGAIPNISAMPAERAMHVDAEGHERYIDHYVIEDPEIPGDYTHLPYSVQDTAFFYFISRLRSLLAGDANWQNELTYRQDVFNPRIDGRRIRFSTVTDEVRELLRYVRAQLRTVFPGSNYTPFGYQTIEGVQYLSVSYIPEAVTGFHLELAIHYLITITANSKNFDALLNNLSRFAVLFNLLRPFDTCNETTLANILNLVMILTQNPLDDGGFKLFAFPNKESLNVYRFDQMLALMRASLIFIPRELAILDIEQLTIIEQLPHELPERRHSAGF